MHVDAALESSRRGLKLKFGGPTTPATPYDPRTIRMTETTTNAAAPAQTRGFQAEVKQLLQLMIHSLYGHPEIFLRELVSNAADAIDKLKFEALAHPEYYEREPDLRIVVTYDRDAKTITVRDNGIGMSFDEVV